MPIDIEGWIEIKEAETAGWVGKASLSEYSIVADSGSDYIFGIAKHPSLEVVAGNRGLPKDGSAEVEQNLDSYRKFEKEEGNFSIDELFGFSYILYSEVMELELPAKVEAASQWTNVFKSLRSLRAEGVAPENIRIVVGAHW